MEGISKKRLIEKLRESYKSTELIYESDCLNNLFKNECHELQEPWMTLDEFLNKPKYEWCWIMLKEGQIHMAYVGYNDSENYVFYLNDFDRDESYHVREIARVMPIHKPEPPR